MKPKLITDTKQFLPFHKYPSLTNHYAVGKERNIVSRMDNLYYATEKIDGTNINITINLETGEYAFGKRTSYLKDYPKPYGSLLDLVSQDDISYIIDRVPFYKVNGEEHPKYVVIYGELYGSSIQRNNYDISKEQKRAVVLYDILLGNSNEELFEINLDNLLNIIPSKFYPHIVNADKLQNLLQSEVSDTSYYGGVCEGLVYKPVKGCSYSTKIGHYPVVKHKTDKYLEVRNIPKTPKAKAKVNFLLADDLSRYVTENRLMNIISHGDITLEDKNIGKLLSAMKDDILDEYTKETFEESLDEAIKIKKREEVKKTLNHISKQIVEVIRKGIYNQYQQ